MTGQPAVGAQGAGALGAGRTDQLRYEIGPVVDRVAALETVHGWEQAGKLRANLLVNSHLRYSHPMADRPYNPWARKLRAS